jgi:hypothetical protein
MTLESLIERIATALEIRNSLLSHQALSNVAPVSSSEITEPKIAASRELTGEEQITALAKSVAEQKTLKLNAAAKAANVTPINSTAKVATHNAAKVMTFEDIRNGLVGVKAKHGPDASRAIMQKFGAGNVNELKPEDFPEIVKACNAAMG